MYTFICMYIQINQSIDRIDKDRNTQKLARVGNSGRRNWEEGLYTLLN